MVFLDTETKKEVDGVREKHRMDIAWTCYVRKRPDIKNNTESWELWDHTFPLCSYLNILAHPKRPLYIFGHNLFFDLQVSDFFYYFTKWGWVLDFVYESGMTFILCIRKEKCSIKAVSTTNFFDTSLKELGKMVNLEKMEVDLDSSSPSEIKNYCHRDVEIIKLAMEMYFDFIQKHELGHFSMTRASQAFSAYRHRFMDHKIYIHEQPEVIELERQAYIGGRCECFELGEIKNGPFLSLDVNSMFPYIMKIVPLPVRLIDYRRDFPLELLQENLKRCCAVAEVSLDTDIPLYAVHLNKKTIFPVGRFRAFLCSALLEEALRRGHLKAIHQIAFYEQGELFTEYVDYFYHLRWLYKNEGNKIFEAIVKLFLNSLYGKFAQWQTKTLEVEDITNDGYYRLETLNSTTGEWEIEYKLFNKVVVEIGKKPAKNTMIAISAHITEWARYILWSIIEGIGVDRVLYCDTDSVKIRKSDILDVLYPIDPLRLGALKVEEETSRLTILGAKSYVTDQGRKLKGVPLGAETIDENCFEYSSFPKMATHMRERIMRYHIVEKITKEIRVEYDKGVVLPSGRVQPFRLTEF